MSLLPKQAGKLPWSEGSLILLQNLQNEMNQWDSAVDEGYTHCSKSDCHFCRLTIPIIKEPVPEFIMSSMDNYKPTYAKWSQEEIGILIKKFKIPLIELHKLLPNRSYASIAIKKGEYLKAGHF